MKENKKQQSKTEEIKVKEKVENMETREQEKKEKAKQSKENNSNNSFNTCSYNFLYYRKRTIPRNKRNWRKLFTNLLAEPKKYKYYSNT